MPRGRGGDGEGGRLRERPRTPWPRRRFLLHLLPPRFIRIRYYGFLAHRKRGALLPLCRKFIARVNPSRTISYGDDEPARSGWDCPRCGGQLRVIERCSAVELRIRAPPPLAAA